MNDEGIVNNYIYYHLQGLCRLQRDARSFPHSRRELLITAWSWDHPDRVQDPIQYDYITAHQRDHLHKSRRSGLGTELTVRDLLGTWGTQEHAEKLVIELVFQEFEHGSRRALLVLLRTSKHSAWR